MSIRCIILDDEQPARRLLESYCERHPQLEVVGSFKNPLEALTPLSEGKADLLFLDIQMPELKGTDLLRSLPHPPQVILTTAYQQYALEGFDLHVADYLLKPFTFDRFLQGVAKATKLMDRPDTETTESTPDHLYLRSEHKVFKVALADIYYIEGQQEYVKYHTRTGRIMVLDSLKRLEVSLPEGFIRIHRSYIANLAHAQTLASSSLTVQETELPIGKSYKEFVQKAFG